MTSEATTAPVIRADGRTPDQLRPISITRGWSKQAEGSALIEFGNTRVLCTASLTEGAPFDRDELNKLLDLALLGTEQLAAIQRETLAEAP